MMQFSRYLYAVYLAADSSAKRPPFSDKQNRVLGFELFPLVDPQAIGIGDFRKFLVKTISRTYRISRQAVVTLVRVICRVFDFLIIFVNQPEESIRLVHRKLKELGLTVILGQFFHFLGVTATIYVSLIAAAALIGDLSALVLASKLPSNPLKTNLGIGSVIFFFYLLLFSGLYGIGAQATKCCRKMLKAGGLKALRKVAVAIVILTALIAVVCVFQGKVATRSN